MFEGKTIAVCFPLALFDFGIIMPGAGELPWSGMSNHYLSCALQQPGEGNSKSLCINNTEHSCLTCAPAEGGLPVV